MQNIDETKQLLREQYEADGRPWVVAYSGGKDSTLVLQLVMELLLELGSAAHKPVYVLSSDTRVEAPNVSEYVKDAMDRIEASAAGLSRSAGRRRRPRESLPPKSRLAADAS